MSAKTDIDAPRNLRRLAAAEEDRARKTGHWGAVQRLTWPRGSVGPDGWAAQIERGVKIGGWLLCLVRDIPERPGHLHLAFRTFRQAELGWREKMRLVRIVCGDRFAVECYPPDVQAIDDADMYHLWVFPEGVRSLGFGLHPEDLK